MQQRQQVRHPVGLYRPAGLAQREGPEPLHAAGEQLAKFSSVLRVTRTMTRSSAANSSEPGGTDCVPVFTTPAIQTVAPKRGIR